MNIRDYYHRTPREFRPAKADTVGLPLMRFAVLCWDTVHAYSMSRPADAVVCVLASDQQKAQDSISSLRAGFDCYETRVATCEDEETAMTLNDFRNRYNTR